MKPNREKRTGGDSSRGCLKSGFMIAKVACERFAGICRAFLAIWARSGSGESQVTPIFQICRLGGDSRRGCLKAAPSSANSIQRILQWGSGVLQRGSVAADRMEVLPLKKQQPGILCPPSHPRPAGRPVSDTARTRFCVGEGTGGDVIGGRGKHATPKLFA